MTEFVIKTMCLKIDLSNFQCPQLFVQFKFHLKQAEKQQCTIHFIYRSNQLVGDVLLFLEKKHYQFTHHSDAKPSPFIEVTC
jgi:hypothetical protein